MRSKEESTSEKPIYMDALTDFGFKKVLPSRNEWVHLHSYGVVL